MPAEYGRPVDEDHALLVGALVGLVMGAPAAGFSYEAEIIDDDEGNHLATFSIAAPSGFYLVHVEKVDLEQQLLTIQSKLRKAR